MVAIEAAIVAGQRRAARGTRKRTQLSKRPLKSTKARLGIIDAEKDILTHDWSYAVKGRGRTGGSSHSRTVINSPSKHKSSQTLLKGRRNNKRNKPGD